MFNVYGEKGDLIDTFDTMADAVEFKSVMFELLGEVVTIS